MSLTRKDLENIAHLARLGLTEEQVPVYVRSLSSIIEFVEQLKGAKTDSVEPMAHPLEGQAQRLRADEVTARDAHEWWRQVRDESARHAAEMASRVPPSPGTPRGEEIASR